MFRFEEDAFLRKGGEYSRNCLSFEEEIELETRLQKDLAGAASLPDSIPKARTVFVSAGGKCTEPLVKSLISGINGVWKSTSLGQMGLENDELVAYLCPSDRRPSKEPLAAAVQQERLIAEWLLEGCSKDTSIVIFATSSAREQPEDYEARKLSNALATEDGTELRMLEHGRLITSFAAAILEIASLRSISAVCYIAPREPVLSRETLDVFAEVVSKSAFLSSRRASILKARKEWSTAALRCDERDARRFEPEGMFM